MGMGEGKGAWRCMFRDTHYMYTRSSTIVLSAQPCLQEGSGERHRLVQKPVMECLIVSKYKIQIRTRPSQLAVLADGPKAEKKIGYVSAPNLSKFFLHH